MQKKAFWSILICVIVFAFTLGLSGCGEKNYTKDDIGNLYQTIKTSEKTAQFFSTNTLQVTFDDDKVDVFSDSDKSFIFSSVYQNYLFASSSLLSGVIDRVGMISYAVKDFSQEQKNDFYLKLQSVYKSLKTLSENKAIFETTSGNLHYKYVLNSYNNVLSSLYNLNTAFANYYFVKGVGLVDFSSATLSDGNVRDMISYQNLIISKVSFRYELLNFEPSNPLGAITDWFENTQILKSYVELCQTAVDELSSVDKLPDRIGSDAPYVLNLFVNMQGQESEYLQEYNIFAVSLGGVNLKNYFKSPNKSAFLLGCSDTAQSCFQIMQNFLDGRYLGYYQGLSQVLGYI